MAEKPALIVRCPHCKNVIRLREVDGQSRVIKYLCSKCQEIVRIDLVQDEVKSSSSPDSFAKTEHRKKVLVADDTVTVRKVAAHLLTSAGYDVLEATDGLQTIEKAVPRIEKEVKIKKREVEGFGKIGVFEIVGELTPFSQLLTAPLLLK